MQRNICASQSPSDTKIAPKNLLFSPFHHQTPLCFCFATAPNDPINHFHLYISSHPLLLLSINKNNPYLPLTLPFPQHLTKTCFRWPSTACFCFFFLCFRLIYISSRANISSQSQFIDLFKKSVSGNSLSNWASGKGNGYCNYTGIACDDQENVVQIDISGWSLSGRFPEEICSYLPGLRVLRLGNNNFVGSFPLGIINCSFLEELNLSSIYLTGPLPDFSLLKSLRVLDLSYNRFSGDFPMSITNLTNLEVLNFNENGDFNLWELPENITRLTKLKSMILTTCMLRGEIPPALGNMTSLIDLELSGNYLVGKVPKELGLLRNLQQLELYYNQLEGAIPMELGNLTELRDLDMSVNKFTGRIPESICRLPKLVVLQLYNNTLEGEIPAVIANSTTLNTLSLYGNFLTGEIPQNLGRASAMEALDLSENRLSGRLPEGLCSGGKLNYLLVLQNDFSGELPESYAECNKLSSSIPESLSSLKSLNVLDLSSNHLTGKIPESLSDLLPNSLNFSNNQLSGPIPLSFLKGGLLESLSGNPNLCVPAHLDSSSPNFPICAQTYNRKKLNCIWVIGISVGILIVGTILFLKRWFNRDRAVLDNDDAFSSSFFSYDVKSFHRLSFDQREIIDSMIDKNIVGYGGSGTVYKIELNNGEVVAVKKLWSQKSKDSASEDQLILDKELKTEVETLGSIRHKNIVKLYCYFSSLDCSLLVYEYMSNGNLWDALHRGKVLLDWPTRHQIALGVAQGLAYLHHDLMPPIIHRDIKSTNILLDVDYQPKVADFGIAKVLQARGSKDSTTTEIAGTYGYLAPEYAYSSKATTKCDVYSFGVVLMELITGKKPVEAEFGENKNIIYWVSTKVETKEGAADVLDKRVVGSYEEDMIKVLRVAVRCTCRTPVLRPTMNEVVQLLIEADPCKFDCCKLSNKTKETANPTKPKNQFDL
ncbi:UNVERIFIED_CONTAM: Receptor protein-tyrosine kinase CEPR1 [Sesamum radiatum]|uniref:non-specific serine/threonine protein kinase n=1 Tax=Sesamum radiatum TaxID=300843 RepID=A0AAW2SID5_SESRA